MSDSFEEAIAEVEEGVVQSEREVQEYPIPDKGMHKAKCVKAELKEVDFKGNKSMTIQLTFDLPEQTHEFQGKEVPMKVFDRLYLFYGPKSKLYKTFMELTGYPPDDLVKTEKFKKGEKQMIRETFEYAAFIDMECEVLIAHNKSKDGTKTFANIESYSCKAAQQKKNAALIFEEEEDGAKK